MLVARSSVHRMFDLTSQMSSVDQHWYASKWVCEHDCEIVHDDGHRFIPNKSVCTVCRIEHIKRMCIDKADTDKGRRDITYARRRPLHYQRKIWVKGRGVIA